MRRETCTAVSGVLMQNASKNLLKEPASSVLLPAHSTQSLRYTFKEFLIPNSLQKASIINDFTFLRSHSDFKSCLLKMGTMIPPTSSIMFLYQYYINT